MRLWIREIAGLLLVLIGLVLFYVCINLYLARPHPRVFEAGGLTFIGFVIFRGGIHLLKVSTAAQVCLQARAKAEKVN